MTFKLPLKMRADRISAAAVAGQWLNNKDLEQHRFPNGEVEELSERSEADVESLDVGPQDINEVIESLWKCIEGRDRPAVVVHMKYSDATADNPAVSCEIGFAVFTLKRGLLDSYSTHLVCDVESAAASEEICGTCEDICNVPASRYTRNGTWILMNIELFLHKYVPRGFLHTPIFCSKGLVTTVDDWLLRFYEKAKMNFRHDVVPLEWLMTALSLNGELNLANEESMDVDDLQEFIKSAVSTHNEKGDESLVSVEDLTATCRNRFNTTDPEGYWKLGRANRVAATHFDFFPGPALGVFLSEKEAEIYLAVNWKTYGSLLACRDHDVKEHGHDMGKSIFCALSVAKRHVFLILDALSVNFGFSPKVCQHYPKSRV